VSGGYLTIARVRGVPIRIHWSAPIGAVVWTGGSPSLVRIAAFLCLIVLHELGHAVLVWRARAQVTDITVHAFGGECWWQGEVTAIQRAMIAFGGVWAQGLLALAVFAWSWTTPPQSAMAADLVDMFTRYNLYNAAFNLIPVPPLDGSKAWQLFPLLFRRLAAGQRQRRKQAKEMKRIEREMKELLARAARNTVRKKDQVS
jgi:stage IV sporulation protein FB